MSMKCWASEMLRSATSAMLCSSTSTASTSGFSRLPPQTAHGTSRRYSAQRARCTSVSACSQFRSRYGITPSKPWLYDISRP